MSKTILVTGGAGFIGSNFVHYMMERYPDYRIVILDNLTYAGVVNNLPKGALSTENDRLRFWYGNVCNQDMVTTLVGEAEIVVHFAAETHVTRSIFDNLLFFQTDVLGAQCLCNAVSRSPNVERFIHISTSEVYGTALTATMDEDHPLNPSSPYASAKCGGDRLVYSYEQTYNIPAVILRPFNNYGPRQHLEKVVSRFITSVLLGEKLTVHGLGLAARDFIFVEDLCRAVDLVINAPPEQVIGQVFNVASGQHRTILSIAEDIVRIMDYDPAQIAFIGERPGQVIRHTGESARIRQQLGWEPLTDWEIGLRRTIQWFKDHETIWRQQIWMRHTPIVTLSGRIEYH